MKNEPAAQGGGGLTGGREIQLKRNWIFVPILCPIAAALCLVPAFLLTWPAAKAALAGQPLPADWTWPAVVLVDLLCVAGAVGLCAEIINPLRTVFTREGIKEPGLWRGKFIRWDEVQHVAGVSVRSQFLRLTGGDRSIIINKLYYRHPSELMSVLRSHLPESASWSD